MRLAVALDCAFTVSPSPRDRSSLRGVMISVKTIDACADGELQARKPRRVPSVRCAASHQRHRRSNS